MREIKFRAWDNNKKEWYFYGEEIWSLAPEMTNVRDVGLPSKGDLILGQFTGLKDRLGKEIYEGDIVKWINKYDSIERNKKFNVDEIVFYDGCFSIKEDKDHYFPLSNAEFGIEVIGNIYEKE